MARMRAEHRRGQILSVAATQFARHGYHGTTTADLAKSAGVTPPVLYRHFAGKRELFIALLDDAAAKATEDWRAALSGAAPALRNRVLLRDAPESATKFEQLAAGVVHEASRDVILADAVARTMRVVVEAIVGAGVEVPRAELILRWRLSAVHMSRIAPSTAIEATERLMEDLLARMDQPVSGDGAAKRSPRD